MPGNKTLGLLLMVIGVIGNNYVYFHDLVKGDGIIVLGLYSWIGIIASLLLIGVGLLIAIRAKRVG
jgi:hypothetical protein